LLNQTVEVELGAGNTVVVPVSRIEIVEKTQSREDELPEWGEDIDLNQLME
jgi:hypothetical protein